MDRGWISLHRKLREHWIWKKPEYVRAWIDLLFRASHKDTKMLFDGEFILVGRGEFITSLKSLSLKWKWSRSKVRRFLKLLQKDSMIVLETGHKATHITICNYGTYQNLRNADEHQKDSKRTAKEQQKDTINKGNKGNNVNKGGEPTLPVLTFWKLFNNWKEDRQLLPQEVANQVERQLMVRALEQFPLEIWKSYIDEMHKRGDQKQLKWFVGGDFRQYDPKKPMKSSKVRVDDYRMDTAGFYIGYCFKCGNTEFYAKHDLFGDSKCCKARILSKKKDDSNAQ